MNFSEIYVQYHSKLKRFAVEFVSDEQDAENLVHDVFVELWKNNEGIDHIKNVNAYMFRLVRNRCMDYLKHKVVEQQYAQKVATQEKYKLNVLDSYNEVGIFMGDLEHDVDEAIKKLPERCRLVFEKSRFEGKKYREIAEEMNISENTVEIQMGIAIKRLRTSLAHYLH